MYFIKYANDFVTKNQFHLYHMIGGHPGNDDWSEQPYSAGMFVRQSSIDCQKIFDEFLETFRGREQEELSTQLGLNDDDN